MNHLFSCIIFKTMKSTKNFAHENITLYGNCIESCIESCIVEALIKDTLNLSTKDNLKVPLYIHSVQNNLQKRTTSLQRTEGYVPSVSIIWRFHCKREVILLEMSCDHSFSLLFSLAMVSISALIMKLASVAGLLTLIATITDTLALYILPNKNTYREVVYDKSPVLKTLTKTKEKEKDIKQD